MHGLRQLPAREVRQPVVADLASPHETVERAQGFLERCPRIERMDLVEINRIEPQPAQRRVQRAGQVPRGQPGTVRRVIQREAALRGQHNRLGDAGRPAGEPAADELLGDAVAVHVGRVDERAACLGKPVELAVRARLVGLCAEGHGPKAKAGYGAPAAPQRPVFHTRNLCAAGTQAPPGPASPA